LAQSDHQPEDHTYTKILKGNHQNLDLEFVLIMSYRWIINTQVVRRVTRSLSLIRAMKAGASATRAAAAHTQLLEVAAATGEAIMRERTYSEDNSALVGEGGGKDCIVNQRRISELEGSTSLFTPEKPKRDRDEVKTEESKPITPTDVRLFPLSS